MDIAVHHQIFKIAMTLENLEAEVLSLPKDSQVTLLARLLERLGQSNEIDQDVASVWVDEAELRDQAMDDGQLTGIHAEQAFQRVRASLQ
ncbi:MAG: addiction module protein [Phormidesmis sp. CAN_BIN44]|nr:addiction module protein [Phormidesmis sp. CAN_BIN44]